MSRRFTLLMLVAVMAISMSLAAQASEIPVITWNLSDWDCSQNPDPTRNDVPTLINNFEWDANWAINGATNDDKYELTGDAPSASDPDVYQTVRNRTTSRWTDWHVEIVNGIITDASVKKTGAVDSWELYIWEDGSGFDAWIPAGTADTNGIGNLQNLSVSFTFDIVNGNNPVAIYQYPTDTAIPEPASLISLLTGIGALGFTIRRRR